MLKIKQIEPESKKQIQIKEYSEQLGGGKRKIFKNGGTAN